MLTFKTVSRVEEVPKTWIYEYYLGIKLVDDTAKTHSFINNDSTPSLCIYFSAGQYRWKDFSANIGGSAVDMVMAKEKLSFKDAAKKIVSDYNYFIQNNVTYNPIELNRSGEYELVSDHQKRQWNEMDRDFWFGRFSIPSILLKRFCVFPLEWYQLAKVYKDHNIVYPQTSRELLYGYFSLEGELYQIYQPDYPQLKFIKLKSYVQGWEQLRFKSDVCIIASSMKDLLAIESFGLNVEVVAPPSETTFLTKEQIEYLKENFKYVFTMFDNDVTGIKAMMKYKELYDIDYIYIPYEKDIAEFDEKSGWHIARRELIIRINKKLND